MICYMRMQGDRRSCRARAMHDAPECHRPGIGQISGARTVSSFYQPASLAQEYLQAPSNHRADER